MDLKKRLAQFDRLSRKKQRDEQPSPSSGGPTEQIIRQVLGLQSERTSAGVLWQRDALVKTPRALKTAAPDLTGIFTQPAPPYLQAQDLLFLDTETTGLAGGTGSLAFLVGVGWWCDAGFNVRQYFLPGPGRETPMLKTLGALAKRFRVVVTFNGNSFDLPLLRTRALLARLSNPCEDLVSWDLLPAVRRMWGRRLSDCRQQTLEEQVCGRRRGSGDIEGYLIPHEYFGYLRRGEIGHLPRVLRHNRRDIIGMAAIYQNVLRRARTILYHPDRNSTGMFWQDAWANGRVWEERGDNQRAADWLNLALELRDCIRIDVAELDHPEVFFRDAIRILKRTSEWKRVEMVIHAGLQFLGDRPWLHREAAILYEHRLVRLESAESHARRAGEPARVSRLNRKLESRG